MLWDRAMQRALRSKSTPIPQWIAIFTICLLGIACDLDGTTEPAGSIRIDLRTDRTSVAPGQVMNVTVIAENNTSSDITVRGSSTCTLRLFVRDDANRVVTPQNPVCTADLVPLTIPAGRDVRANFVFTGTTGFSGAGSELTAGDYRLIGKLESDELEVSSRALTIQVRSR